MAMKHTPTGHFQGPVALAIVAERMALTDCAHAVVMALDDYSLLHLFFIVYKKTHGAHHSSKQQFQAANKLKQSF